MRCLHKHNPMHPLTFYPPHSLPPLRSDAIYSAMYDGSGLIEVLRGHEYLSHPFAVTMYGGEVYWTDWRTNTLAKANKWTGHNVTVVQRTNTQPFDLQVYHPSRQPQGWFMSDWPFMCLSQVLLLCGFRGISIFLENNGFTKNYI